MTCDICGEEACGCSGQQPLCPTHFDELRERCLATPLAPDHQPDIEDV